MKDQTPKCGRAGRGWARAVNAGAWVITALLLLAALLLVGARRWG